MEEQPPLSAVFRQHLREEMRHHRLTMDRLGVPNVAGKLLEEMQEHQEKEQVGI
jgi:hypothetical protein